MPWYKPEDFPPPPAVDVWDENWDVLQLFLLYQDQWLVGMSGPVALNLVVFQDHLRAQGITGTEYKALIRDLRTIQSQALYQIHR